jgi:hypothetical protein
MRAPAALVSLALLFAGCGTGGLLVVERKDAGCEVTTSGSGGASGAGGCETGSE